MEIKPFTSFDSLRFGATRQSIREHLESGYQSFQNNGKTVGHKLITKGTEAP